MEFKHINDCWNYLRESENYDDLLERLENLPRWSGDWDVEESPDHKCLVTNYYYEEEYENWDQDQEEIDIPYPQDIEDIDDRSEMPWDYSKHFD